MPQLLLNISVLVVHLFSPSSSLILLTTHASLAHLINLLSFLFTDRLPPSFSVMAVATLISQAGVRKKAKAGTTSKSLMSRSTSTSTTLLIIRRSLRLPWKDRTMEEMRARAEEAAESGFRRLWGEADPKMAANMV